MKRHTVYGAALFLSLVAPTGCDRSSSSSHGDRDAALKGSDGGSRSEIGGGFEPDPQCDYACEAINDEETICSQICPDGCVTIELNRETSDDEGVYGVGSMSEFCPESFPDEQLHTLTCEIHFSIPSATGDCVTDFSAQTCQTGLELCMDGL